MTIPIKEIIPREVPANIAPILTSHAVLIDEFVNFGSHLMNWNTTPTTNGEENIAPTMLFRHFLDLIDSVSLLAREGCGDTSKLLLRGALEVAFSLEYLFERETHDRAMAFLVAEIVKEIRILKKMNPATKEGMELQKVFNQEKTLTGAPLSHGYDLNDEVLKKEQILKLPQFQKAYQEYERLINAREKNPAWYRFFGGPRNIRELSKHLKKETFYELLYRKWSGAVHGSDIYLGKLNGNKDGGVDIVQLRFVKDIEEVVQYSLTLSLLVFNLFVNNRIPHKKLDMAQWYLTVRDEYLKISTHRVIVVE